MKLFGAAMVRNEADIIEAFVRHNLTVLDGLAIVDHGSTDGTTDILAALAAEGLPIAVRRDDSLGYHQIRITSGLVREVLARTPADFVFVIDADEFLKIRSRPLLEDVLHGLAPGLHALIAWQTYVPDFAAARPDDDVRMHIAGAKRVAADRHGLHKVVVARHFARTPAAVVGMGNHLVYPSAAGFVPGESNPHARIAPDVVALAHVPVRSGDQFIAKVAVGWLATLATRADTTNIVYHWRKEYADLASGKALTPEQLTAIAANYSVPDSRWRAPEAVACVDDPFLAPVELRYTHLGRRDPLSLVLTFAEKVVAGR